MDGRVGIHFQLALQIIDILTVAIVQARSILYREYTQIVTKSTLSVFSGMLPFGHYRC